MMTEFLRTLSELDPTAVIWIGFVGTAFVALVLTIIIRVLIWIILAFKQTDQQTEYEIYKRYGGDSW